MRVEVKSGLEVISVVPKKRNKGRAGGKRVIVKATAFDVDLD